MVRNTCKEVLIVHFDFSRRSILESSPNVLIAVAYLIHMRIRYPVRAYETIVTEILVADIIAVEITAIGIDHLAVLSRPSYRLIYEVPDEASLVLRILSYKIPVLLETALGIAHRVSVLALYQRTCHLRILAI